MNSELIEKNFDVCLPEELDGTLDAFQGTANIVKFNRWGSMVAAGCTDGKVYLFDVVTKGVIKVCGEHVVPITSICWSRNGRKILTASVDRSLVIWNVLEGVRLHRFTLPNSVTSATFNPRNDSEVLVTHTNNDCAMLKNVVTEVVKQIKFDGVTDDSVGDILTSTFDYRGKFIVTGTSKGRIGFHDAVTTQFLTYIKQAGSSHQIKNIIMSRRGDCLITNSQDRIIRTYNFSNLLNFPPGSSVEPNQKLSDIVNKAAWKAVCVSGDGDYICGASSKSHSLYIWERNTGSLMKMLHGLKGEVSFDVQWHPTRPIILSVAAGIISVWTQAHVENWSAFAPEFTELEENSKYIEKESEFDLEDEDADEPMTKNNQEEEEEFIDVIGMKSDGFYYSSDEEVFDLKNQPSEEAPLWFLPVAPEFENSEDMVSMSSNVDTNSTYIDNEMHGRKRSSSGKLMTSRIVQKQRKMK